jgi:raffinose/stachyose/melibiose transport system substrate-binding protein
MKNLFPKACLHIILLFSLTVGFIMGFTGCEEEKDTVKLTFTSWRIDDAEEMESINKQFSQVRPDISVRFDAYDPVIYDSVVKKNLDEGRGADIIFLWSYDRGRAYYDAGYLYDLIETIPNLSSYAAIPLHAWTTGEGVTYAVPSVGVTHGIYYKKSIFQEYSIQEPASWEEFMAACDKLKASGETVIAQGARDSWTLNRVVFCGLGANFYGGETARQALMNGTMKLTDQNFIKAFEVIYSLRDYFPEGFETLGYEDARQMFASGDAAMFIGGSWEISVFEGLGADTTDIGWFPPPVKNAGDKLQYCFHVDAGIAVNKNSKNLEAALEYAKWTSSLVYAQLFMSELPGFFSYNPETIALGNPLAHEMLQTASTADLTVRLMSEKLSAQSPTGEDLLNEALQGMMMGIYTPEEAAVFVQEGLDMWYHP